MLDKIINTTNDVLYSYILIILLVLGGIYFTVRTRFAQIRLLGQQIKSVTEKTDGKGVSSFQALMVSTASRVGTGNIIGVATALCLGGFGSVFWMWVIAIVGAASAFVESTLHRSLKSGERTAATAVLPTTSKRQPGASGLLSSSLSC